MRKLLQSPRAVKMKEAFKQSATLTTPSFTATMDLLLTITGTIATVIVPWHVRFKVALS